LEYFEIENIKIIHYVLNFPEWLKCRVGLLLMAVNICSVVYNAPEDRIIRCENKHDIEIDHI